MTCMLLIANNSIHVQILLTRIAGAESSADPSGCRYLCSGSLESVVLKGLSELKGFERHLKRSYNYKPQHTVAMNM